MRSSNGACRRPPRYRKPGAGLPSARVPRAFGHTPPRRVRTGWRGAGSCASARTRRYHRIRAVGERRGPTYSPKTYSTRPAAIATACFPSSVKDRICADSAARLKVPERLPRLGIQREEVPFVGPREHQPAGRGKHARPRRRVHLELPAHLPGGGLQRANRPGLVAIRRLRLAAAREKRARLVLRLRACSRSTPISRTAT